MTSHYEVAFDANIYDSCAAIKDYKECNQDLQLLTPYKAKRTAKKQLMIKCNIPLLKYVKFVKSVPWAVMVSFDIYCISVCIELEELNMLPIVLQITSMV